MKQDPPPSTTAALADLRRQIDGLDAELVTLLAKRQRCVERVIIPERIDEVLTRVRGLAQAEQLEPDLAVALWREMIERFIAFEERALDHSD
jgi:isochorismate pyruvate lyase